jgi:hypothetical protein
MICAFNGARELVEDRSESGHSGPEPPGAYSDSDIDLEHASSPEHPVGRVRSSLSGICSLTAAMNAASGLNFSRLPCKILVSARGRAKASLLCMPSVEWQMKLVHCQWKSKRPHPEAASASTRVTRP